MAPKKSEAPVTESNRSSSPEAPEERQRPKKLFGSFSIPSILVTLVVWSLRLAVLVWSTWNAYRIRLHPITKFGPVIHEFDPWFNFRATQYLAKHGMYAFFHWFDHMSWYPLGRPVGTTIYPGMQMTAVVIHRVLRFLGKPYQMSLNDVCCYIPCWFGGSASLALGLLTYECSGSANAAVISTLIFGIIPAHTMRSMGGGYDNESIAMTAICLTFYLWVRSLRSARYSLHWGVACGLSYAYMVAAWGGYVFVINMIGIHAAFIVITDWLMGKYSTRVYRAYTSMFLVGTTIAVQIPVVGWTPLKSLEQIGPLGLFIMLQLLQYCELKRRQGGFKIWDAKGIMLRLRVFSVALAVIAAVVAVLFPMGYFGPVSARIRGLFVKHTRTGNPLVDSVAEHQPASAEAYWHYLHYCYYLAQAGLPLLVLTSLPRWRQMSFMLLYALFANFFSHKMARLMIIAGPVAAGLSAVLLGRILDYALQQFWWSDESDATKQSKSTRGFRGLLSQLSSAYAGLRIPRIILAILILLAPRLRTKEINEYTRHCEDQAHGFSNPQIMFETQLKNGQSIIVDDYYKAYLWLRENTPKDARVMAWWDYGYQITGIGNRTSIADGNTWNHEHIATLGKCLTSPVKEAHSLIRHIADYVLVWAGGYGDDLAKSPHMARIGNSVYRDICPDDPVCSKFGFYKSNSPTPMMEKSLLYNLHSHGMGSVKVDDKLFKEVYTSKYGLIRIFAVVDVDLESKRWLSDPANRICDAPGSWYCSGQYPKVPAWEKLMKKRRPFGQLEDFNRGQKDDQYHKEYMRRMGTEV